MKKIQFIVSLFILAILSGCTEDSGDVDLNSIGAPSNISALVTIKQDNSGNVTFSPRGEGVSQYEIYYADGTVDPGIVEVGGTINHTYPAEGVYQVKIVGITVNGTRTEVIQEVTVSFLPPTDLDVTIGTVVGDSFSITVKAKANLETYFQVYFGDVPDEVPTDFMEGETITHKYAAVGTYQVRVVAKGGGAASTENTYPVTISNPLVLPITFETVSPVFADFGDPNVVTSVTNNPTVGTFNPSAKVGKLIKTTGSQVWGGTTITLASPIDFSTNKIMKMKVWSPKASVKVLMKLQTATAGPTDATNIEIASTTSTVVNDWQELSYDFTAVNTTNAYVKIVLFFDFDVVGDGKSYYFDDIKLVSGIPEVALPLDFEIPTKISGDFGGASTATVANPHNDINNSSTTVGACKKSNGAQVWGGSFITLTNPINFTTQKKMTMKVWSTKVGMPVLLKVENLTNTAISKEVVVPTTIAGGWETLTFDFTTLDLSGGKTYQKVVFIFDNATVGDGTTYYFDDIKQSN